MFEFTIPGVITIPGWVMFIHPVVFGIIAAYFERSFWLWFFIGMVYVFGDIALMVSIYVWRRGGYWEAFDTYLSPRSIWRAFMRLLDPSGVVQGSDKPAHTAQPAQPAPVSVEARMERAGQEAEARVRQILQEYIRTSTKQAVLLNNVLLVFQRGTRREFSVELDHVVITSRHVFLVETKYKSGRISAPADAKQWVVSNGGPESGGSTMRNALMQVKQSAAVLRREMDLPAKIIPIVAIHGRNVEVVDAPTNVVQAERVPTVIDAFDASADGEPELDVQQIEAQIARFASEDPADREAHVTRIRAKLNERASQGIVSGASI